MVPTFTNRVKARIQKIHQDINTKFNIYPDKRQGPTNIWSLKHNQIVTSHVDYILVSKDIKDIGIDFLCEVDNSVKAEDINKATKLMENDFDHSLIKLTMTVSDKYTFCMC